MGNQILLATIYSLNFTSGAEITRYFLLPTILSLIMFLEHFLHPPPDLFQSKLTMHYIALNLGPLWYTFEYIQHPQISHVL